MAGADASEREALFQTKGAPPTIDVLADDGSVHDTGRIMFLRAYLTQLERTILDRVPLEGSFRWGTMDHREWTAGFGNRVGFV